MTKLNYYNNTDFDTGIDNQIALLELILENSIEVLVVTDAKGIILKVNNSFTTVTGYTPEEAIGKNPRILKSDRHKKDFYKNLWDSLIQTGMWEGEIWNRRKNGETYPEKKSIKILRNSAGDITHFVSLSYDITDIKRDKELLNYQAFYDPLTNLPNRNLFFDRANNAIQRYLKENNHNKKIALLFLDLDNFKNINNTKGHNSGDKLIVQVAVRLSNSLDKTITICHYGADEFVFLVPDFKSISDLKKIVEKIVNSFNQPFIINDDEFYITATIGISIYPDDAHDVENMLKNADIALNRSKKLRKGAYAFFTSKLNSDILRRIELERKLRKALLTNEFNVFYQPKINIQGNIEVSGFEALIRWKDKEKGFVPPDQFIPVAEELGIIEDIGKIVLETVCNDAKCFLKHYKNNLQLNINISALQFNNPQLLDFILDLLKKTSLSPSNLCLEITETIVINEINKAIDIMKNIRKQGICISIDDFGTGYSSLSYLNKFPVNELKIDLSFIKNIISKPEDAILTKNIVQLGKNLGFTVVAEGVETKEQLEKLIDFGCDTVQGFLFSPALPINEILKNDFI